MKNYELVLGFEVHVELATASKMFCGCPADHFGKPPNSQTCPVCLGLPGALPVPNAKAIEWCIKLGLALGCQINLFSKFDRKNYFYPDLPKGYQISQYDQPFCFAGQLTLASGKVIRITRVHMEEDTGKLHHAEVGGEKVSLVDFNRSGVPLVEIVTEPDFDNPDDGTEFLKEIQLLVRALQISSADMEKGSMRLEANISVRPQGSSQLPDYKVEVKNVNSFRFVKKAIEFEIKRQTEMLLSGKTPLQETRGFSESRGETVSQRGKEAAHEYRYFPEPDIPPFEFTRDQIDQWKSQLPTLPGAKRQELITKYHLSPANASILTANNDMYILFTQTVEGSEISPKVVADILVNKRFGPVLPKSYRELVEFIQTQASVPSSDPDKIKSAVASVLAQNPKAVADYKAGKEQTLFFLIGQVKKQVGHTDVQEVKAAILTALS